MKVLGVIPARFASTRFPGKPLHDILGKPMIQHVYERCVKAKQLEDVVVATDDQRIFDAVEAFGGHAMMTSEDCQNGTERCLEVLNARNNYDVVINIQGDEPLVDPLMIDDLASLFNDDAVQLGTMVKSSNDMETMLNPNRIKVALGNENYAMYFSRSPIPFSKNSNASSWIKHVGIYGYRAEALRAYTTIPEVEAEHIEGLEQLRWLGNGYKMKVGFTNYEAVSVDAPEDVDIVLKKLS